MKVDDLHVAYLRSQIAGEEQGVLDALNTLDPGHMTPLVTLVHEAFVLAVRTWFGPAFTHGEVIRLVATLRALNGEDPDFVNPAAAESVVRRALGENVSLHADPAARLPAIRWLPHRMRCRARLRHSWPVPPRFPTTATWARTSS
jgi:hypothetical protein